MDTKSKKSDSLQEKETKNNETLKWDGVVAAKKKNGSPGAFALAFVLCVLLGVGGVVAGFVGLSFVDAKLRSAKGAAEYVSGAAPEDLLSDRPYIESEFFKSMAGRNLEAVFLLHYHYREGVDKLAQEAATKAYENCLREIYGLLNDRGVNYFYFSPHEYIPFAETMMEAAVEIGPVYIAFDTRKIQGDGRIFESYSSGAEDNDVVGEEMKPWGVDGVKEALEEVYADELKQLKEALLHSCQTLYREDFEMSIDRLNASGALYYAGDGDAHIANVKLGADGLPADPSVFDK
ncbi:MAG: hypothetical protein LBO70_00950, partial [Clostridiales Family XIII bacterium]|nr:hypothetical protein [Clostridiales Family XIII bacterium]